MRTHADLITASDAPFVDGDSAFMLQPGAGVIVPLRRKIAAIGEVNQPLEQPTSDASWR